jgi:hypothetical protein
MQIIRCTSPDCGRPFQSNRFQFSVQVSLPWARGEIICPHCGHITNGDMRSVFLTHALLVNEETEFCRRQGDEVSAFLPGVAQNEGERLSSAY